MRKIQWNNAQGGTIPVSDVTKKDIIIFTKTINEMSEEDFIETLDLYSDHEKEIAYLEDGVIVSFNPWVNGDLIMKFFVCFINQQFLDNDGWRSEAKMGASREDAYDHITPARRKQILFHEKKVGL